MLISIHAPAWGATLAYAPSSSLSGFQSTLPHGERRRLDTGSYDESRFQSTLPHGERRKVMCDGLTVDLFQSTLPHGERPQWIKDQTGIDVFQSTLPHGERPSRSFWWAGSWNFNPRSRMGSDGGVLDGLIYKFIISIHAPAWGATCGWPTRLIGESNFNPRSRMGSDGWRIVADEVEKPFQSTLPHGERPPQNEVLTNNTQEFQSTLPHGERRAWRDQGRLR